MPFTKFLALIKSYLSATLPSTYIIIPCYIGYPIPQRFPLTKAEERSLKKIRRKIKNKISAQESRRKKKEYMEELEKRVQMMEQRIMDLERENFNLKQMIISSAATTASGNITINSTDQQNANEALIESILLNHQHQQQNELDHQPMISSMSLSSLNTTTGVRAHDEDDDDDDDDDSDDGINDDDDQKQEQQPQQQPQQKQTEEAQEGDEKSDQSETKVVKTLSENDQLLTSNEQTEWKLDQEDKADSMVAAESSNIKSTIFKPEQIEHSDQNNGITSSSTDNESDEAIVGSSPPKRIKLEVTSTP